MSAMFSSDEVPYNLKRMIISMSEEDHREIKARAAKKGVSMRIWIIRALAAQIKREQENE